MTERNKLIALTVARVAFNILAVIGVIVAVGLHWWSA